MDFISEMESHPSIIIIIVGFIATFASAIFVCFGKNENFKSERGYFEIDENGQRVSVISDYSTNGEYTFYRGSSPTSSRTSVV